MADGGDAWRAKRAGETALQWRSRVMREEEIIGGRNGPLVTAEAQQHSEYADDFVLHVETFTLARTKRNTTTSPFLDLYLRGTIDTEQFAASQEIASAAENVRRAVSVRGASLEARVDNSGSARDALVEHIAHVHISMAYTRWRSRLPMPKAMVLDMLLDAGSLKAKARKYRIGWPKARVVLIRSLDNWIEIRRKIAEEVDERDVEAVYHRLGAGVMKTGA